MVTETRRGRLKSPAVERAPPKKRKTSSEVETAVEASPSVAEETPLETEKEAETAETVETLETAEEEEENVEEDDEVTAEEEENGEEGDEVTESIAKENEEVGDEGEGEADESEEGESESDDDRNPDAYEETIALRPLDMYFKAEEYSESVKVATRCYLDEVMETFDALKLTAKERSWFENHPQFSHLFHMPRSNHKVQPMWMLLLRTARIERKKEAWFVVNGVPIQYGLQQHALISGLHCHNYPINWQRGGSLAFKKRHFIGKVLREDVKKKLEEMPPDNTGERLKMAVLYFLSSIIYSPTKTGKEGKPVLDVFVRYVNTLKLCHTFPWGRLSFDHMLESIYNTLDNYKGKVNGNCTIPGFCIPLEVKPLTWHFYYFFYEKSNYMSFLAFGGGGHPEA